jgi:hypothetical protein
MLNRLNFLAYEKEPEMKRISLRNIKYMGEFENKFVTMKNFGLLPSISRYFKEKDTSWEDSKDHSAGHFRFFHKFMADNEIYLVSTDHPLHEQHITDGELLLAIMKG